ncbi:hypothetical protein F2Q68_00005720 [Brassica cretica]|uniref:Uncharacterized protein n=1 Tax=Brassica cretica TaxID=69181 RepID=A0A8S9JEB8_BRACR|nr:hypothetical protein F2Q68_00005720 [Brassica cretica]
MFSPPPRQYGDFSPLRWISSMKRSVCGWVLSTQEDGVLSICCSRRARKTARSLCRGGCRRQRKTIIVASPANRKVKRHDACL